MAQETMAQEKAVELFKKYYCLSNNSKSKLKVIEYETAKQCALIAVERSIKILKEIAIVLDDCLDESKEIILQLIEDEEKLKQEIEKQ